MDSTAFDHLSRSANIRVRKLLGRSYLRENRLDEACQIYVGILADYPSDADVLTILGNLYRLSGCPATAEHLYSRALEANPDNHLLRKQIAVVHEEVGSTAEEALPFLPEAIERLVGRLHAESRTEEARCAADMLDKLLAEAPAAAPQAERVPDANGHAMPVKEGLQQLMPALIELNIRQARADGRADVVDALHSLQSHIARQPGGQTGAETGELGGNVTSDRAG